MAAFGRELDSLSDAIAFGVAPVVCGLLLTPLDARNRRRGGLVGRRLAFAAGAITRLGFYNVVSERAEGFIGVQHWRRR